MNRIDLLLTHFSEECVETALRASKASRYGLDDIQPGQSLTNAQRIAEKLLGLITTVAILESEGVILMPRDEGNGDNVCIDPMNDHQKTVPMGRRRSCFVVSPLTAEQTLVTVLAADTPNTIQ